MNNKYTDSIRAKIIDDRLRYYYILWKYGYQVNINVDFSTPYTHNVPLDILP